MSLINNLSREETAEFVSAILLMTVFGTVFYQVWKRLVKKYEGAWMERAQYVLLVLVLISFMFPMGSLVLRWLGGWYTYCRPSMFGATSPIMTWTAKILIVIWGAGMLICLIKGLWREIRISREFSDRMKCDKRTEALFARVCRQMGVKNGRIRLYRSFHAEVPFIRGIVRPVVILPVENYSEENLSMIFSHEVMHAKQKALLIRRAAWLAGIVHWFNFSTRQLKKDVAHWTEYHCDEAVSRRIDAHGYYEMLLNMSETKNNDNNMWMVSLVEEGDETKERIRRAAMRDKVSGSRKTDRMVVALVASLCVAFFGTFTIAYVHGYEGIFHLTDEAIEEPMGVISIPVLEEHMDYGVSESVVEAIGESVLSADGSIITVIWSVPNGSGFNSSDAIYATNGDTITLAGSIFPINKVVKVGIINENGTRRYVNGSTVIMQNFLINTSGSYKIFVENNSGTTVTVNLSANLN